MCWETMINHDLRHELVRSRRAGDHGRGRPGIDRFEELGRGQLRARIDLERGGTFQQRLVKDDARDQDILPWFVEGNAGKVVSTKFARSGFPERGHRLSPPLFLFLADALVRLNVNDLGPAKLVFDFSRTGFGVHQLESFSHRFLLSP